MRHKQVDLLLFWHLTPLFKVQGKWNRMTPSQTHPIHIWPLDCAEVHVFWFKVIYLFLKKPSFGYSVRLHAQLNQITGIVWLCPWIGQQQLSEYTWWENRFIGQSISYTVRCLALYPEQFTSGSHHFSEAPLIRTLGCMETPPPAAAEQLLRESAYGNNPFLLHVMFQSWLQRVKAKVNFPQFLLHHGRDNPHYES